ncbi:NAD-dependent epimerase/dehydratase family protein [Myxococcus qinghaiensis]|uniref:NAD-dependent epimerase/dehydratase family protein n=1 Tax=Myxococcus qinghaiensis TaxID=2906758 RepID=UPI0020A7947C|nr:NAD-dependent epimerase/dehydratase family protein [Myxococcus qinghaiensis]MCP3170108.1 NAD-dependent epimerase/dehydratase family protein [Myxococcus qinghaiensis]
MNLFITGATGFIGGSLALDLKARGHSIRGLVRDDAKGKKLAALGIEPVRGDLDDTALLTAEARRADGVINAASSDHDQAILALIEGVRGSGKPLIHTSGSSVIGDDVKGNALSPHVFDEETPFIVEPEKQARHALDNRVLAAEGARGIVLCNTMIYGTGKGLSRDSVQIPPLVAQARKSGVVRIVGKGINRWSNVHLDDVTTLYALALERAPAGAFYFVENGEASYAEIGEAIAARLKLGPVQSWSVEEASREWGEGHARYSFGSNSRVRGKRARRELGWAPRHDSVTAWIRDEMPVD